MEQILEKISIGDKSEWVIESDETITLLDAAFIARETVSQDKIMETLSKYAL